MWSQMLIQHATIIPVISERANLEASSQEDTVITAMCVSSPNSANYNQQNDAISGVKSMR